MKNVTFYLGPTASKLSARQLTITQRDAAAAYYDANVGAVESATVSLPDNRFWDAKLVDTHTGGNTSAPAALQFNTGSLQFPGPRSEDRLAILSMEDESSSSG